jgi:hypothetical protein
MKEVADMPV